MHPLPKLLFQSLRRNRGHPLSLNLFVGTFHGFSIRYIDGAISPAPIDPAFGSGNLDGSWGCLFWGLRGSDAYVEWIDDGDTSGEFLQVGAADEIFDECVHGHRAQGERAEQNDAGMGAGRVLAQVGELDIQRQQHAVFIFGCACDFGYSGRERRFSSAAVRTSCPRLVNVGLQMPGEILIQFELHCRVPVFQTLSCARSAAYGERRVNVVFRQLRVVVDDLRLCHAFGKAFQNHGDLDAGIADAGSPAAYVGPGSNARHHLRFCHFYPPCFLPYGCLMLDKSLDKLNDLLLLAAGKFGDPIRKPDGPYRKVP